jgi:hypothetical protein
MKRAGSLLAAIWTAGVPLFVAGGAVVMLGACTGCQSTVRQAAMPQVAAGTFDGVAADPGAHRLYLADGANKKIDVVDISSSSPRFVQAIDVGATPHGLAAAPDIHFLYAGLTGGAVAVIDTQEGSPHFMQVVTQIKADPTEIDLLDYNASTKRLFAATGAGGDVIAIDTMTNQVIRWYPLHVPTEQPRYNPADGMLYVSSPATSSVVQINLTNGFTTRNYFMKGCRPFGLDINPGNQIAVAACGGAVALLNLRTGAHQITQAVPGSDLVSYDSSADRFVVAAPHGAKDSWVGVFDGGGTFIGSVAASPKAHGAVFDPAHGVVYAPGASGLMSFTPGACAPPPEWLQFLGGLSVFAVPLLAMALFLFLYARRPRRKDDQPTFYDLQQQDLADERERMRAFEDAVLGPQLNPGMQPEP